MLVPLNLTLTYAILTQIHVVEMLTLLLGHWAQVVILLEREI